ncbi:hypothetical protein NDU88_008126 [Pleurodeles waltl]|uniref:Secreted protein n=1 Tax=Pleurodeles waltl TaxID=8319 RepID=A0AAV7NDB6_PLEWA|nr:hypothetical protein NDU88_008126 [Pleurodeles waltl]
MIKKGAWHLRWLLGRTKAVLAARVRNPVPSVTPGLHGPRTVVTGGESRAGAEPHCRAPSNCLTSTWRLPYLSASSLAPKDLRSTVWRSQRGGDLLVVVP